MALIGPALHKEGGVRRHPSVGEFFRGKMTAVVVAYDSFKICRMDKNQICKERVALVCFKSQGDIFKHMRVDVKIIAIEDTHDVPRGQGDAFVHGIVQATVGFAHKRRYLVAIAFDDLDRTIGAGTVYGYVFDVFVSLGQN